LACNKVWLLELAVHRREVVVLELLVGRRKVVTIVDVVKAGVAKRDPPGHWVKALCCLAMKLDVFVVAV
jgi:hypothetical protein